MITNSATSLSALTFIADPETSDSNNNLIISSNILKAMDGAGVATAYWTGEGHDNGDITNPDNWKCYSARGVLMENAVPTEATIVFIQINGVDMQVPAGATLSCRMIKIADCSLGMDCDWSGLTVVPTLSGTLDLAGSNLKIMNLLSSGADGAKVVNTSETDISELQFTIDTDAIGQMDSKLFGNNIKVVKDGEGRLTDSLLNLGDSGVVTFIQNDSTMAIGNAGDSRIGGYTTGSNGHATYQLSGGSLTVNNNLQVGGYATGEFYQSGGTVELPNNWLSIGRFGGSKGSYTITGGIASTLGGGVIVGEDGTGEMTVSGSGVVSSKSELRIAANAKSKGDARIDSGSIKALNNFQIGRHSTGTLTQSGGEVSCNVYLSIGRYADGIGLYSMTGGTYTSPNNFGVIGEEGQGTFDVSGTGVAEIPKGVSIGHTVTGRGLLSVRNGGKLVTTYIRQGPGRAALSFDGGTIEVPGSGQTIVDFFRGADDVSVGAGGLTFDVGDNYVYATGSHFGSRKMDGPITKTGTGTLAFDTLPAAETLSVKEGTLVLTANPKPTLVHRWSFNGTLADSVGNKTASSIGTGTAFNGDDTAIVLSGNGNGAGSVNLGSNILPTDVVTIEIWATKTGNANWSRIFDYGPNNQNYLQMSWVQNTDPAKDIVEVCNGGVKTQFNNTMAEYVANTPYHISMTLRSNLNGSTSIRWARRNVSTGNIEKWGSAVVENWTLANLSVPVFYLGHSQYSGDGDAKAIYDEVRIWHGVLSDEELTANALLGPDTLQDDELGNTLPAEASETLQANNYLLHRWSFNGTAEDEIGGQTATYNGNVTYNGDKAVYLAGGGRGASWIDLGAGAIPTDGTPFTFEAWTTVRTHNTWARIFSLGNQNGGGDGSGTGGMATGIFYGFRKWNHNATAFSLYPTNVGVSEETIDGLLAVNTEYHFVFVVNPNGNGGSTISVYIYNARTGEKFASFIKEYPNWDPSLITANNCWLGHSQWNDMDACAEFNEVRIWNAALSEAQIRANTAHGPDVVLPITEASTLATQADLGCLDVTDGAMVNLSGNTFDQAAVSGTGEIMNGTLNITSAIMPGSDGTVGTLTLNANTKISGTVKLDVGDLINVNGSLDLTNAKIEVTDIENLAGGYVFATVTSGIVGTPDTSSLQPRGYDVCVSRDGKKAMIVTRGTLFMIR